MLGIGGKSGAVEFDKTVHIHAPVEEVYGFWSKFENFPKFMTHLKEVRHLENGRWHWVAAGPGGVSIPWDARITEEKPNQLLAWSSVPGSVIRTEGRVRFDKEPDGSTRVSIHLSYSPPAGVLGHAVAWLFGADPKSEIDDDMVRLKVLDRDRQDARAWYAGYAGASGASGRRRTIRQRGSLTGQAASACGPRCRR